MDLVAGAVGSILTKLAVLLHGEYKLQKNLPEQIEYLKNELVRAHTALCKVGAAPPEQLDPQVRLWARELKEASYDMEDILDAFLVDVVEGAAPPENKDGLLKHLKKKMTKLLKKSKARHDIASAIEDMKKRLQEMSDSRDRYSTPVAVPAPATTVDPRLVDMHREAGPIIGIERTRAELKAMLQSSTHGHGDAGASSSSIRTKIVSLVGAGGLGKTTLAKAVYDELSTTGYDCRAFISVGRNPDLVQVFTNIFLLLDEKKYESIRDVKNLQLLIGELRKFLETKRYFVVIDDIWEPQSLEIMKSALVGNNCGSRVIITTRKFEVAKEADEVYKLGPLSYDNSRKLFYTRLFGGEDKCPNNHPDELSDTILKKCGGVPLAIITMAGFLLGKSKKEWIEVCTSPGFYQDKNDRHMENTMHILSLSYYDLPSHLKTCLLYLSVFPEDYLIHKDSLIWKWIAEGFVEKKPGQGLFEIGEEYFHDLINRSLIQGEDSEVYGIMHGFRVHDMVLDLIISKSNEENFVSADGTLSERHTRRLALKNRELDLTQDTHVNLPPVRSFIVWRCAIVKWALHPRLKLIRVLALENCTFREECHILEHIGNLLHLRYLGIRGHSWFKELPEGIGALKFLQTLNLEGVGYLELPCSIISLTQLVRLRAPGITPPIGVIGKLTSLEELQITRPYKGDESKRQFLKDLGNLRELRVLKINNTWRYMDESMQTDLIQSLGYLQKMQHLTLGDLSIVIANMNAWDAAVPSQDLRCLFLTYISFPKLPSWINSARLPSLSHLEIYVLGMDDQGFKALGGLPQLCYLKLFSKGTITSNIEADGSFQELRSWVLPHLMIQFVGNEDSSASFTTCHISKGMAIERTTKKDDCRVVPAVVMPKLEELEFGVKELTQNSVACCGELGLKCLPSIRRVKVNFWCLGGLFKEDVEREEAALRQAVEAHPNRPALQIEYINKEYMKRRSDGASTYGVSAIFHGSPRRGCFGYQSYFTDRTIIFGANYFDHVRREGRREASRLPRRKNVKGSEEPSTKT